MLMPLPEQMTEERKHTVVAFGEVLWDLLPDQSIIGGAPFNFTYRINSLGANGLMISRVGVDKLGQMTLQKIRDLGLSLDFIQKDDTHPTGTVEIFFDNSMNPDFNIIKDVAYDFIELTNPSMELCERASCICFGTLAQRNEKSRDTLYQLLEAFNGSIRYYDINLRKGCYSAIILKNSLVRADIVKLNDSEALEINRMFEFKASRLEDVGRALIDKYDLQICLITIGAKGVLVISRTGEIYYIPGYRITLADPLGSGDAFSAGFLHAWLNHNSLYDACNLGNILGAITATQRGATVPIQHETIDSFRRDDHVRNIDTSLEQYLN